eukprot:gnl/MRDRNA2_/MRDRNA2_49495_c0_seq1.p1 gnl/MRDRNA2_/MRDRNA2_49495_c0~~gnl/MRDRNA2_/MRDRNA2_49495_c0_seq1.p1  ORF type:complete len:406 (+),score=65.83 gnl/MRDRNA2_/MRDRNA2_49495_c0_seq1:74-1291(+)
MSFTRVNRSHSTGHASIGSLPRRSLSSSGGFPRHPLAEHDRQKRRRPPQTAPAPEPASFENLIDFIDAQGGKDCGGSAIIDAILHCHTDVSKPCRGLSPAALHSKRSSQPSVGCVGSVTWQGALQSPSLRRNSSISRILPVQAMKAPKRDRPLERCASGAVKRSTSVESSASTTDSDANSDKRLLSSAASSTESESVNSRPPSRGGSSCGSLDLPDSDSPLDPECPIDEPDHVWDVAQFSEGKIPFKAMIKHLKSDDPEIRRSTIKCIEEATANQTENATLQSTGSAAMCLSDSNDLVRKTSVKWLCSVLALAKDSKASDLAKRSLLDADPYSRYDAVEALLPFVIRDNSSRACRAMDWYRSQDKDPSIRLKAERSLMIVAGCKKQNAVRCARAAVASANEAVVR